MIAIEHPPFEVTETGWGEFEIQIKVHFVPEASEKPMTLFHFLHLHPYGPNKEEEREKGLTVQSMQYEEIVQPQRPKHKKFRLVVVRMVLMLFRYLVIRRIHSSIF